MTDPTTPAPAKTMSETMTTAMTEQDARLIASYRDGANVWFTKAIARRILATRDALQAKTEECAHLLDLQRVADADAERVDKVCQIIAGHRDDYRRERDQARAALKEAQKDTARLDWLQAQGLFCSPPPMRAVRGYEWAVRAVGPLGEMPQKDVRAAIDAARAGGANG